ncbi:MAG: biliverdin-producing heme oxygenase [Caulobacteraceae bacterium]|nr:biliverdin-producing heme oxygenase [Caulobacter sp.]
MATFSLRAPTTVARRDPGGSLEALSGLRRATQAAHRTLEDDSPLLREEVTLATYGAYLRAISPLVASAESFVVSCAPHLSWSGYDFDAVCRHGHLEADLAHLGPSTGPEQTSFDAGRAAYERALAAHPSVAGRLGVLYVLEGSTLGGQLLCRHLRRVLRLAPRQMRYLFGHGRATGSRWRATCALLNATLQTPRWRGEACAAANTTFRLFAGASGGVRVER